MLLRRVHHDPGNAIALPVKLFPGRVSSAGNVLCATGPLILYIVRITGRTPGSPAEPSALNLAARGFTSRSNHR